MKKNVMMRVAAILLVCVLASTCGISGTFAKYVTSAEATDTARVAKWGIELTVTGNGVFAKEYDTDAERKTVVSAGEYKVVAPGTKSSENGIAFSVSGTPEVAFKLTASLTTGNNAVEDIFLEAGTYPDYTTASDATDTFTLTENYYPVVFTLVHEYTDGGYSIMPNDVESDTNNKIGDEYTATKLYTVTNDTSRHKVTITGTLTDINAVLAQVSENMKQVDPSYPLADTFTLTWEWVFVHGDTDAAKALYNKADTFLGNVAADATKWAKNSNNAALTDKNYYNLTLNYTFTITVEQVD